MKNIKGFTDFLLEFVVSHKLLYHYTTVDGLAAILSTDRMISKQYDHISFTRNPALKFYDRHIRIVFDGDSMSDRIHIEPYMYDEDKDPLFKNEFGDDNGPRMSYDDRRKTYGEEREERAKGPIQGIKKYIIRVDVKNRFRRDGTTDDEFVEKIHRLQRKFPNVRFNLMDKFPLPVEVR